MSKEAKSRALIAKTRRKVKHGFSKLKKDLKNYNAEVWVSRSGRDVSLHKIVVPKEHRGKGVGSAIMRKLSKYADERGHRIVLSPTSDFGGSRKRLEDFYERHGFVKNKGRHKDFSTRESMYRNPS